MTSAFYLTRVEGISICTLPMSNVSAMSELNKIRMYQDAWDQLKNQKHNPKTIRISAEVHLHPRVYKAIRKEKDMDLTYKYELSEAGKSSRLTSSSAGTIITIILTEKDAPKKYGISQLF